MADAKKKVDAIKPPTTLVMVEMDKPRETRVMSRGNYLDPKQKVEPGTPAALHPWKKEWPANRLGFAKWLVDPANPLVARVTVNRWWGQFFSQGVDRRQTRPSQRLGHRRRVQQAPLGHDGSGQAH